MSYQEIKKISRGKTYLVIALIFASAFLVFFKKVARAQKIIELSNSISKTAGDWICTNHYVYTTEFKEYLNLDGGKTPLGNVGNSVNKCQPITAEISNTGLWDGRLIQKLPEPTPPPPPPPTCEQFGFSTPTNPVVDSAGNVIYMDFCMNPNFPSLVYKAEVGKWCCDVSTPPAPPSTAGGACGACACACACGACACGTPPADFLECASPDDCLTKGNEGPLDSTNGTGKGVFKEPIAISSLKEVNNNPNITCADGACTAYASGSYTFEEQTNPTKYYGQCKDTASSTTINLETDINAVSNQFAVSVVNRPPTATVTFAKNPVNPDEEVDVYCDIVDPDECSDKIASVKWTCVDSAGVQKDCSVYNASGVLGTSFIEEIPAALQTNPYRATAKFRANKAGSYAVVCEGEDDDTNIPLRGEAGVAGIQVGTPETPSTDEGVIGTSAKYCTVLANGNADKAICGKSANVNHKALTYGINVSEYQWKCGKGANEEWASSGVKDDYTCSYDSTGSYTTDLRVKDQDTGKWFSCYSDEKNKVKVTDTSGCKVTARKLDNQGEFSNTLSAKIGDTVEAKVERECLEDGAVKWTTNATKVSENNETLKVKLESAGIASIKAKIGDTDCGQATVETTETVKFGH